MINVSDKLVLLTQGQVLKNGINEAIQITRNRLFDAYSEGKVVSADDIKSSAKRIPRTHTLAFCKFFNGTDIFIQDPTLNAESFLNQCNELTEKKKQGRNLDHAFFEGIIPNYEENRGRLSATFSHEVKRGVLLMLFVLWKNGHVLLTTNYEMKSTKISSNASPIMLCEPLYTEVIAFFQSFRQKTIPGTAKIMARDDLTYSIQNTIQSYAWRVVVATDWHKVEDVKLEDCVKFLDHLVEVSHQHKSRIPFPIAHMVKLLEARTKKLSFTSEDLARARSSHKQPLGSAATIGEFNPNTIKISAICEPLSGREIYATSPEWIDSQLSYLQSMSKKNKNIKEIQISLTNLNEYLFSIIPESKKKNGEQDISPPTQSEFDRRYFNDTHLYPTLREHIENSNRQGVTVVRKLSNIDNYFKYLEEIDTKNRKERPFINPIMRKIDFPLVESSKGTVKKTISQLFNPALMSYVYAMESLFEYVFHQLRNNNEYLKDLFLLYAQNSNKIIKTEDLGYCPFIYFRGQCIPITEIKLDLFVARDTLIDNLKYMRLPAWSQLIQMIVCLETGIRTLHVEWLDIRTYDKHIKRHLPLNELETLHVSTDKVRRHPWSAKVSKRVIQLLDKQRAILNELNTSWSGKPIWYDNHEDSVFGKIVPAFPSIACTSIGLPSRASYEKTFTRMFYSFQEFANKHELFSKKIEWVEFNGARNVYKSEITPHSCRATVISNAIHHLPPQIIGSYITGHISVGSVMHYVALDEPYMNEVAAFQANSVRGMESLVLLDNAHVAIRTDTPNSALHRAICKDKEQAMHDFSGTCFEVENKDGERMSGLSHLQLVDVSQLAHHSTHICPCNNICPREVVEQFGAKSCGQCPYAIKTVDHLPRIDAHIRNLHAELIEDIAHVQEMVDNKNTSLSVIEEKEFELMRKSAEITAWTVSLNILEEQRKNASKRDRFLIGKPEIVEKYILRMATEDNPLTNLLLRIRDAIDYPEYLTPQLKASITKARNKLLVSTGQFDLLINEPKGHSQIDEFRGIFRGLLESSGLTLDALQTLMFSPVPQIRNPIPMLGIN